MLTKFILHRKYLALHILVEYCFVNKCCLLHAGIGRELPLSLPSGSWPLQRYTNILHITNVSSSSACLRFSVNPFEMCVSHLQAQGESCVHINCMFILKFHSGSGLFVFSFIFWSGSWALSPLSAAAIFLCLIGYFFYFLLCVSLVFYRLLPVCVSVVLLIQVFLPTSGASKSGDHVRSPAASFFAHRALRCWTSSASTAGSATQALISSLAAPGGGWRPATWGVSVQRDIGCKRPQWEQLECVKANKHLWLFCEDKLYITAWHL